MEQAILRVDFKNKKLIPNQQNNSDFYKNKHELCDGEVTIFTTSNSGGNWQMRMRVEGHMKFIFLYDRVSRCRVLRAVLAVRNRLKTQ